MYFLLAGFAFLVGYLVQFLQQLPDWGSLEEVLLFLVAGGSAAVVGVLFSFLAENFEFWHKINSTLKLALSLVLSIAIGAGAYYLLALPDLISFIQPYYALVITIVLVWLGSQVAYMVAKASGYAAKKRASALGLKQK